MSNNLEQRIHDAIANPRNLGEMTDADSVGTVGNPDCNDMLRMWVKFKEDDQGRKIIDRATFQTFGCETALAVASVATELIAGKTIEEALSMSGPELSAPLGPLPPMKIHCAQLVEGALRAALTPQPQNAPAPLPPAGDLAACAPIAPAKTHPASATPAATGSLIESFSAPAGDAKVKVVLKTNAKTVNDQ